MEENGGKSPVLLVIFDMDGTITRPYLSFDIIRREIGVTEPDMLILDFISTLLAAERERAFSILHRFEEEAAANAEPQEGAVALIAELRRRGVKTAIFTRNSRKSVDTVLDRLGIEIDEIITRGDGPPKPAPDAIFSLLSRLGVSKSQAILVGDFQLDIIAGKEAGLRTVLLENSGTDEELNVEPDLRINNLLALLPAIERWERDQNSH